MFCHRFEFFLTAAEHALHSGESEPAENNRGEILKKKTSGPPPGARVRKGWFRNKVFRTSLDAKGAWLRVVLLREHCRR